MSKIVLVLSNATNLAASISTIRQFINVPILQLKADIEKGKPIYEATLFQNDKDEVEKKLMGIINNCEALGDKIKMYELAEDEPYLPEESVDFVRISKEYLINIMD